MAQDFATHRAGPVDRLRYRALSFAPPSAWRETSWLAFAIDRVSGDEAGSGGARIEIGHEEKDPAESLDDAVSRLVDAMRREGFSVVESGRIAAAGRPGRTLRLRRDELGVAIERRTVILDADAAVTTSSLTTRGAPSTAAHAIWSGFLRGLRRSEDPGPVDPTRLRWGRASLEPPAGWTETTEWSFVSPARAVLVVAVERGRPTFADVVARRLAELAAGASEVLESIAVLRVEGRAAHRIRSRKAIAGMVVEEVLVLTDGGGTPDSVTAVSVAAAAESDALEAAVRAQTDLLASVRFETGVEPAAAPYGVVHGESVRALRLCGQLPGVVHGLLMARGFLATRLPLYAWTTRAGERQFWCADGRTSRDAADPALVGEWVYLHPDGGLVRVFPRGHGSPGLGGARGPVARVSVVAAGSRDLTLDAEDGVVAGARLLPRSPCRGHGLPPVADKDAFAFAAGLGRATWIPLAPGPAVALPLELRAGLAVHRTIVTDEDFAKVAARVERLAARGVVRRIENAGRVHHFFGSRHDSSLASLVVDRGNQVIAVDPLGPPASVDPLQRCLRDLLRHGSFRVFDDATGEDVTATVKRLPSFLVAATRRRPALFGDA